MCGVGVWYECLWYVSGWSVCVMSVCGGVCAIYL